jgi:Xaa-Pro aminopeptidase
LDLNRKERIAHAVAAIRAIVVDQGLLGVVLTRPGFVSWATGGMNPSIDRTAGTDVIWLCVTSNAVTIVTTDVEAPRVAAEMDPAAYGIELTSVPWWDADAAVSVSAVAAGGRNSATTGIGSDGHPAFDIDLSDELTSARMVLCDAEIAELRALGHDAALALQTGLASWIPGETDFAIQGRIAGLIEATGADSPVLLVGGDDRVTQFRHPAAIGAPAHELVMAVVVARRSGLHVAATRYAHAGEVPTALEAGLETTRRIQRAVIEACTPGASWGDALTTLNRAYTAEGHPGVWRQHYQGGPIGFAQREFEIAPVESNSRWWDETISANTAIAWNPSIPGGSKDEDTFLVTADGTEPITWAPGWPAASVDHPDRTGVLVRNS